MEEKTYYSVATTFDINGKITTHIGETTSESKPDTTVLDLQMGTYYCDYFDTREAAKRFSEVVDMVYSRLVHHRKGTKSQSRRRRKLENNYRWSLSQGAKLGKTTRRCEECGKEFVLNSGRQKYCDRCSEAVKGVQKTCELCGVEIPKTKQKYCAECAITMRKYKDYLSHWRRCYDNKGATPPSFQEWQKKHVVKNSSGVQKCIDCGTNLTPLRNRYCEQCGKIRNKYNIYTYSHKKLSEYRDFTDEFLSFEQWKDKVYGL